MSDWPYAVPKPAEGETRACPICGREAIFNCYHEATGSVQTRPMPEKKAERLRRESGEYEPSLFVCSACHREQEIRAGVVVKAGGWLCPSCAAQEAA